MPAYSSSLNAASRKPIENVLTGSGDCSAIEATTALESMPPLRNAPSGTSAIIRIRTDSSKRLRSDSQTSGSLGEVCPAGKFSVGGGMRQYRPCRTEPSGRASNQVPGGSLRIDEKGVHGSGI